MSFAKVYSAQTTNLKAEIIDIEVDLANGLHSFAIVGLPDKAVEESRDRVSATIKNSGFKSPKQKNQKIVIALAPADIKKEGPIFDVGIALAYLLATEDISFNPEKKLFLGELSLDGELRPVHGILPLVREAKSRGFSEVYLPKANAREAALIDDIAIFGANTLREIFEHLHVAKKNEDSMLGKKITPQEKTVLHTKHREYGIDFSDVVGQESAKRGLEIAAAGGHNIAMYGPPGTGKTMLAKAFCHLLPQLSFEDVLDITAIHSVAGNLKGDLISEAPFRSPHHTSSYVSLVGGGAIPKPGEITLAHKGVLFLDEFPEFDRRVIETLRQPLEDRVVSISRARGSVQFPAHFILIAAMNPCPCGNYGIKGKECVCSAVNLLKYQRKISGPIMDRIDLWVEVSRVEHDKLSGGAHGGEKTDSIKNRVENAREIQAKRFKEAGRPIKLNSEMNTRDLITFVPIKEEVREILNASAARFDLSARAYHRVMKLARTIADLDKKEDIAVPHILEALQYRPKVKNNL
jgi:magnesium chelatase family protein